MLRRGTYIVLPSLETGGLSILPPSFILFFKDPGGRAVESLLRVLFSACSTVVHISHPLHHFAYFRLHSSFIPVYILRLATAWFISPFHTWTSARDRFSPHLLQHALNDTTNHARTQQPLHLPRLPPHLPHPLLCPYTRRCSRYPHAPRLLGQPYHHYSRRRYDVHAGTNPPGQTQRAWPSGWCRAGL